MIIERVQYDGSGEWVDVTFTTGRAYRVRAAFLHEIVLAAPEVAADEVREDRVLVVGVEPDDVRELKL